MADIKTFSISDLSSIKNIDHEDLLLVSDYEGGKCYTRKMDMGQLLELVTKDTIISTAIKDDNTNIGKSISEKINNAVYTIVKEEVKKQVTANLSSQVLNIISVNYDFVWDVLDGRRDGSMIIGQ